MDILDLGPESHVQHPVRFVQNQIGHRGQIDAPLLKMIDETARRGDDHLEALL
jgi:hypothetical protein